MKRYALPLLALLAAAVLAPSPAAAARRVPQAPVTGSGLQDYFDSIGESIDVRSDQLSTQRWKSSESGNDPVIQQIELIRHTGPNSIGVYDANGSDSDELYEIFPAADGGECRAVSSFLPATSTLTVNLFDKHGAWKANRSFNGVNGSHHGFYLSGPGGVGFTEDGRHANTGEVHVLVFAGTGENAGGTWLCFENDDPGDPDPDDDFDDTILFLGPLDPTPTARFSWASVKALFR